MTSFFEVMEWLDSLGNKKDDILSKIGEWHNSEMSNQGIKNNMKKIYNVDIPDSFFLDYSFEVEW